MFADPWIITLLVLYGVCAYLLLRALVVGIAILRNWDVHSSSELQLTLERKNYLASVSMQFALFLQILILALFLFLVNVRLPRVIAGAMCATGSLGVNPFGYPALYIKLVGLLFYVTFLFINYLDRREPAFPLTPQKYRLLLVVLAFFIIDLMITIYYFSGLNADIIANCCSMNFVIKPKPAVVQSDFLLGGAVLVWIFYGLSLLHIYAVLFFKRKHIFVLMLSSPLLVYITLLAVKYHFVKFIYGMPAHNCLFDIFWAEYYYIGYLIFGSFIIHLAGLSMLLILVVLKDKLKSDLLNLENKIRWISALSLVGTVLLLSAYWIKWIS